MNAIRTKQTRVALRSLGINFRDSASLFTCSAVLLFALTVLAAENVTVGTPRETLIQKWGKPKSSMQMGKEESLTFEGKAEVVLREGKVARIEGLGTRSAPPAPPLRSATARQAGPVTCAVATVPGRWPELASFVQSSREAKQPQTEPELHPVRAEIWAEVATDFELYGAQEPAIAELRDNYEIEIYVPRTEELNVEGGKLTGTRPSPAKVNETAIRVKDELARYPKEFVQGLGFQRLVLIMDLRHKGVAPGAFVMGPAGAMFANPLALPGYSLAHELFHFVDYRLFGWPARAEGWSTLHPDATYGSGGRQAVAQAAGNHAQLSEPRRDLPGFVTLYAQSAQEEDRAEVFATLIARRPLALELIASDSVIAAKCRYVLDALERIHPGTRDALGYPPDSF